MYQQLLEHARTQAEKDAIEALLEAGSHRKAAALIGKSKSAITAVVERIRKRLSVGDTGPLGDTVTTRVATGYSTLIRHKDADDSSTGKLLEWIKTKVDFNRQLEAAQVVIDSMVNDIEPLPKIPYKNQAKDPDLFSVIPLGDPHIGLLTWSKEVGEDWDLNIADRVYRKVFTRLLERMPDTEHCVLVNTGDFFHADNIQGTTSRSGHRLDLDGRHGKWLDAGFIILRMFIDACLRKYKTVDFYNVPGNHDDILGRALGSYSEQLYLNNPRCVVHKGDNPFQYFHRGEVLLGFAHGHTCKGLGKLPGKMADDEYKLWGLSRYRHWITGHVHHNQWIQFKEHPGCTVESVGIIPPKDAYAHGGAYGAGRGIQGLVFNSAQARIVERKYENVLESD